MARFEDYRSLIKYSVFTDIELLFLTTGSIVRTVTRAFSYGWGNLRCIVIS